MAEHNDYIPEFVLDVITTSDGQGGQQQEWTNLPVVPFPDQLSTAARQPGWEGRALEALLGGSPRATEPHRYYFDDVFRRRAWIDVVLDGLEICPESFRHRDALGIRLIVDKDPSLLGDALFLTYSFLRQLSLCAPVFAGPSRDSMNATREAITAYKEMVKGITCLGPHNLIEVVFAEFGFVAKEPAAWPLRGHAAALYALAIEIFPEEEYGEDWEHNATDDTDHPTHTPENADPFLYYAYHGNLERYIEIFSGLATQEE